jgi:serine/threonine-protein kinase
MLLPFSLSSDGKTLVLTEVVVGSGGLTINIGALSTESDHKYKLLLKEQYYEAQPKISHDGRWMAYMSSESGEAEIYVRPFPELNKGRWQVSTGGGDSPLWSPDCRELFYRHGDSIMAVAVETEPTFKAGKPEALFRGAYSSMSTAILDPWDINPDGKRFLIMKEVGSTITGAEGPRTINIVLNWLEELKQRVPAK